MVSMDDRFFYKLMNTTDRAISDSKQDSKGLNHEKVANRFMQDLQDNYKGEDLCTLIACAGFIPDMYDSDSSEETLFSKLVEVLVAEWATRIGCSSYFVKEKASYEDVNITIGDKVVVCDAKSFRLGRSQAAPNVKDFLKLEDIRKWLSRHKKRLGGLVTYPDTHEWKKHSDAFQYCSTKDCPTVMLPYTYLAVILHYHDKFDVLSLERLWDYDRLFPVPLKKKMDGGNRVPYWEKINSELIDIIGVSDRAFYSKLQQYKNVQSSCIESNLDGIIKLRDKMIADITKMYQTMDERKIRKELTKYKIEKETADINKFIARIKKFRL